MFEAFLATTSSEGLQPLGSAAQRSFELVHGTIRDRLGPEHAALFAEPVATEHGDRIDWYAAMPGRAVTLAELPEDDRTRLCADLGAAVAAIRAEAETVAAGGSAADQRLAEALLNAIEIPGEEMIRAVRGPDGQLHPVLIHWAWIRDERRAVRGVLTAMVPRPGVPQGAAVLGAGPVAGRRGWWWLILLGWLLLAAMLAAILALTVAPCGLWPGRPDFCPVPAAAIAAAETERQVIADEIARLERQLAEGERLCQPVIPLREAAAAPPSRGQGAAQIGRRVADAKRDGPWRGDPAKVAAKTERAGSPRAGVGLRGGSG